MRVNFLRLSIAAVCIALGSSAWAQNLRSRERTFEASETLAADLRRARIHSGPFYLLSYLQFSDLGYESQFFFPTSEQGGGLSLAVSAPQKLYFVPAKKTVYAISFTPEYAFFSKGASNDRTISLALESAACGPGIFERSTANSSPPSRATA